MANSSEPESAAMQDEPHYEFGKNWSQFIEQEFHPGRVEFSREKLLRLLNVADLTGKTFLDIGCGSGLHSLAAWKSGAAQITSFDYDENSVSATNRLRDWAGSPANWSVQQGSVLDQAWLAQVPEHEIVYSWGVLHHTGQMWEAIRNARSRMQPGGLFCIALYTTDVYLHYRPDYWLSVKRRYNQAGPWQRRWMEWSYLFRHDVLPDLRARRNPLKRFQSSVPGRGMEYWTDLRDWLGGWPMEFAGIYETREFCERELGLRLLWMEAGEANTEYVFTDAAGWDTRAPQCEERVLSGPFEQPYPGVFQTALPELADEADCPEFPTRSQWVLFEDDAPLTVPHQSQKTVAQWKGGRYCHWRSEVWFSTSDGSDAASNGRRYSLRKRLPPQ